MKHFLHSAKILFLVLLFCGIIIVNIAQAHPGRTDSSGCHTCRTNCSSWGLRSGEYHCSRAKTIAPQPKEPIKSKFGENGTGYTQPAPEYKTPVNNTVKITPTPKYKSPLIPILKNTEQPKSIVNQSSQPQPQKGFWQWLFSLFK